MESFFYGDPWNPRRPRYAAPIPDPKPKPKPRVVSIPVHCVDSAAAAPAPAPPQRRRVVREEEAAVRIQRVFRGFLVRRNMERVRRIAAEAEEAERRIAAEAAAIGGDARERVRVGEMLMRLLLRLDSVRGVREYRRKVIRRVIALQEAVDSISPAADSVVETPNSETLEDAAQEEESEAGDEDGASDSAPMEAEIAADDSSSQRSDLCGGVGFAMGEEEGGRRGRGGEGMERLVAELRERSAEQCRIMAGLVERVERLERAMRRMETKKKMKKKMKKNTAKQLGHKKVCF